MFKGSEDPSNGRSDEFKTGLGNTETIVHKHAEKERALRREKRDEKIARMRNRHHYEAPAPGMFELSKAIAVRDAFIATHSLESSQYLKQFISANAEGMNEILCAPFLEAIMAAISKANHAGVMCNAANFLVNIMADASNENVPLLGNTLICKPAFYNVLAQHICDANSPIRFDMWKVVANVACMCQDARNYLFASLLLPIFLSELDKRDPATLPMLLVTLVGATASEDAVINEALIQSTWKRVLGLLPLLLPAPQKEEEPNQLLEYTLTIIQNVLQKSNEAYAVGLLRSVSDAGVIEFLVGLCDRVSRTNFNVLHVQRILVLISKYNVENHEFVHRMRQAGCIQLMARLSVDANERIKKEAMMWIGNYSAEGSAFVQHLVEQHAYDGIIGLLRKAPKVHLLDQALYALVSAVKSCCRERNSESDATLRTLLTEKQFLDFTVRHVGQVGCDTRTCDILSMWVALLKWDKRFVLPILEDMHALDRVDDLLGSRNPAIYKLASQVDDLRMVRETMDEFDE